MIPVATRSVGRRFGDVVAVDEVDLEVDRGEIVGLLGANGAGKTTLIRMLLGLISATSGSVELFGGPPDRDARRRLGYMPQGSGLYDDLTATENLAFVAGIFGVATPRPDGLESAASQPVGRLSLGLRRSVAFSAAMCHTPELLVLDEPTSGVGPLARSELWDQVHAVAEAGAAVLVTTHYMDEAEQCDRLVILARGRVVASGTVDQIVGETRTVVVETDQPPTAMTALEDAGVIVVPSGRKLRAPGASADQVQSVVGAASDVEVVPASLEETFMVLAADEG